MLESTFFAPEARSTIPEFETELSQVTESKILTTLLKTLSGLLVIINHNRQIIAVNEGFMHELGLEDVSQLLGVRLGEALHCVHSQETAGGCGTSRYCSTCGAAIATMKTLTERCNYETLCTLTTTVNGEQQETALKVTTTPFEIDDELFVLVFLQDVSREQEWQVLEQLFFHDFNNILGGVIGAAELMISDPTEISSVETINTLAWRMKREIDVQKVLFQKSSESYQLNSTLNKVEDLFTELNQIIVANKNGEGKKIQFIHSNEQLYTDKTLLLRILLNMTLNALEAISKNHTISVSCRYEDETILFSVWNESVIPEDLQKRVFQRYFSTKSFVGRGLGSYSIKLFGEKYLGGQVSFTSKKDIGTTFNLRLPQEKL